MTKRFLLLPLAALALLAACGKTDSSEAAADSVLAAAPAIPKTPHIVSFDIGRQAEPNGRITGGTTDKFTVADTIVISVRAQYTAAGDAVSARLRQGGKTVDSAGVKLTAPDSTGFVTVPFRFGRAKGWPTGTYQIETYLGTASQGIKEIAIH